MKKYLIGLGMLLSVAFLSACANGISDNQAKTENGKIEAIATFYPMYEFTKEVIGDEGNVSLLISAGTEPHDYEPSAKDIAKISDADVFVYNSEEMETWVDQIEENIDEKKTTLIEASDGIDLLTATSDGHDEEDEDHEDHDHSHDKDPHVWTDPVMAIKEVNEIKAELSEKYPAKKAQFEKNAAAYIKKLTALDQEYQAAFSTAKNKTFVVQHAAFGYLAHQYGLTQESISGISPDQEPSASRLAELKHFVEEHGTKVIYFEENANSKVAETLAKETGVKMSVLNPLESLTQKQMDDGETYISVMQQNLKALKESIH